MAISQAGTGTILTGSTSVQPAYPAGAVAAGRVAILKVMTKPNTATINTPAGWALLANGTGGTGTQGVDTGQTRAAVFWRLLTGAESGAVTTTITSGNTSQGVIDVYAATNGFATANFGGATGGDATHNTAWSATMGAALGFAAGDLLAGCSACCSNASSSLTDRAVTAAGATFGAVANARANGSATGQDCLLDTFDLPVLTGPATGPATYTVTHGANNSGVTALVRLVEVATGFRAQAPFVVGREARRRASTW